MNNYEFTSDWFSNNHDSWQKKFKSLQETFGNNLNCLEVGSYEGRSVIYTLDNFIGTGNMYVIDRFDNIDVKTRYYANINKHHKKSQITTMEGPSFVQMAKLLETMSGSFHHIYIDAGKTSLDNIGNLILGEGLLSAGGIITVDDYRWKKNKDRRYCPKFGIDIYRHLTLSCDVIEENWQISFKKRISVV